MSLSTTEAEYKASSIAAQECVWLRRLVEDVYFSIHKPIIIQGDNQSALKLTINPICHTRIKHIKIEHHFILEMCSKDNIILENVLNGTIDVMEVHSKDIIVEIFPKSFFKGPFELFRATLGPVLKIHSKGKILK